MKHHPFESSSTKAPTLEGQNKALYEHLAAGKAISFLQARSLGIGNLGNRISILRDAGITVYERNIRINNIPCQEYSLEPFEN